MSSKDFTTLFSQNQKSLQSIDSLEDFLLAYPWYENSQVSGNRLNYFWEFRLNAPLENLWDYLIDTSSFNQRMGLPPMQYNEVDGKLFGKTKNAGFRMEWEEIPWEWEYCKTLNNARIYSKGFAKYVRTRYLFHRISENETLLKVYFGWIPRHWLGSLILKIGMSKIKQDYAKVLSQIVKEIQDKRSTLDSDLSKDTAKHSTESNGINKTDTRVPEKVREIQKKLTLEGCDASVVGKLVHHILYGDENDLYRLQPKKLAKDWRLDSSELLKTFLYGSRYGLLTLSWDLICPHCRGVRNELKHLGDIPTEANCDVCDIDFSTNSKNSIEITFHVHPSIREIQKRFFCAAEPATKRHIYFQKFIQPNSHYLAGFSLDEGTYRLRSGNSKTYGVLEVQPVGDETGEGSPSSDVIEMDTIQLKDLNVNSGSLSLKITNPQDKPIPFIIETREEDQYALRPGDLLSFKDFRNLFSEEYIGTGITLDIGVQTILFTDIVGSTKLYHKYGDSIAFSEVRKHFIEIYKMIEDNNGVVVKTIGDSVMASFASPEMALTAGVELQEFFQNPDNSDLLKIRISLHTGTCLAVNFNNSIDYFGNTVNYAAKLQRFSEAGDIVISEDYFNLKLVKRALKNLQEKYKIKRLLFNEKWDPSTQRTAYRIHID